MESFLHIYIARREMFESGEPACLERRAEIAECGNEKVKSEKRAVWNLLETAVRRSLGIAPEKVAFFKKNGKWGAENFCFSLSHSGGLVAVAVSDMPVGVDVEFPSRFSASLARKILTDREREKYGEEGETPERLCELWTLKEAAFKRDGKGGFSPQRIETELPHVTRTAFGGTVSAVSDLAPAARFFLLGP